MTIAELDAFNGFNESFGTFDNAQGGDADNKASIEDVQYVRDNPDQFTALEVANATAFLSQNGLMARLDTARDNNDVVGGDSFGSGELDDSLWSLEDLQNFEHKQSINFALAGTLDIIDVAGEGGTGDGFYSQLDYQRALDNQDDLGLTAGEVWAIESVIAGDLYDKHWVEANKGAISLAAFVVGGPVAYLATNVAIDLGSDPDFFSDVDQAIFNFSPTGIATNMAASIATDPLGAVKAAGGVVSTLGNAAYEIGKLTPLTPQGLQLMLTDPGQFFDNQLTFVKGVGDFGVGLGQLVGAVAIASNPISNKIYEDATGTNVQDTISGALLGAAELAAEDPVAFAGMLIDWEGLKEDPIRWAGSIAPEIVIEVLTAGAASGALATRRGVQAVDAVTDITRTVDEVAQIGAVAPTLTRTAPRIPTLEIPAGLRTPITNKIDELHAVLATNPERGAITIGGNVPAPGFSISTDWPQHLRHVDLADDGSYVVSKSGSIAGGHNADEFAEALLNPRGFDTAIPAQIVTRTPVLDSSGRVIGEVIDYRVPSVDSAGNPLIVDGVQRYKPAQTKTVYDPAVISDDEMLELLESAAAHDFYANAIDLINNPPPAHIPNANGNTGSVSYHGREPMTGLRYSYYVELDDYGTPFVTNIHPGGPAG